MKSLCSSRSQRLSVGHLLTAKAGLLKSGQRGGRQVLDELPVEVSELQEGLNLLVLRCWPICHSSQLHWVHLHCSIQDDEPKVFHPGLFKLALLRLEIELMLAEMFQN